MVSKVVQEASFEFITAGLIMGIGGVPALKFVLIVVNSTMIFHKDLCFADVAEQFSYQ